MTDEERVSILTPGYLENIPPFLNHHGLDYLNKWAEVRGIQPTRSKKYARVFEFCNQRMHLPTL
jgi:hypothetical protein